MYINVQGDKGFVSGPQKVNSYKTGYRFALKNYFEYVLFTIQMVAQYNKYIEKKTLTKSNHD